MQRLPYVGVAGVTEVAETLWLAKWSNELRAVGRLVMVGVLVSSKTLAGQQNRYPGRYPQRDGIGSIFLPHSNLLNVIHYATDDPVTLEDQLESLVALGGPLLQGFQLNMAWPDVTLVRRFQVRHPQLRIVLQINRRALEACNGFDPVCLARQVAQYEGVISDVLLDQSGGHGEPFNPVHLHSLLMMERDCPGVGVGIAGGLGPLTMHHLPQVVQRYPHVSWDAESGLRDRDDELDLDKVRLYLELSAGVFRWAKP